MLFLYKLRAFENVVEWLPVFIIQAVALVALGKVGTCVLLCVPYTIGKLPGQWKKDEPLTIHGNGIFPYMKTIKINHM